MILVNEGQSPILLCLPHTGTDVPPAIAGRLNATGRLQTDLSWRLEDVFDLGLQADATVIRSTISRQVIDLDQNAEAAEGGGTGVTGAALCPIKTLDGKNLYKAGEEPGQTEIEQRVLLFHTPFHKAVRQQIARLKQRHNKVVVLECQSMRSNIRGVTDKGLPLLSVGSRQGAACAESLRHLVTGFFNAQNGYSVGVDEQIVGGYISETYGQPDLGTHVISLLFAQRGYLRHESPPFEPDKTRVRRLRTLLQDCVSRVIEWAEVGAQLPVSNPLKDQAQQHVKVSGKDEAQGLRATPLMASDLPGISSDSVADVEDGLLEP